MKSFDVFDTLIGRKYFYPNSVFEEIEKETGFENFTWWRKHSEFHSQDKSLDGIYETFLSLNGCSREDVENLKSLELQKEIEHSFPILSNIKKVTKDDVLVSDTYLNEEQLSRILKANGITEYSKLVTSYDGKSSGRFWHNFSSEHHLGDNRVSDYENPSRFGTPATLFETGCSEIEQHISESGFDRLAYFCRMMRLTNPFDSVKERNKYKVWEEQSQINFPALFLVANYLNNISKSYYKCLAFMQRDCCFLYPIFSNRFPQIESRPLYASRFLLNAPTETFDEYMTSFDWDTTLIVDLQATGNSVYSYFGKHVNYLPVINSNLETPKFLFASLLRRIDGFTDKIEKLNYASVGKTVNVRNVDGKWVSVNEYQRDNDYILAQEAFRTACLERMKSYDFTGSDDFNITLFEYLMRDLESECVICGLVNHEEI